MEIVNTVGAAELEKLYLAKAPQATRDGGTIRIKTSSATAVFTDNGKDGEGLARHYLIGQYQITSKRTDFIILTLGWEGYRCTIVNGRTGETIRVAAEPILSPYKSHYLVPSIDLEAFNNPNRLDIISVKDFSNEFTIDFDKHLRNNLRVGPEGAKWISPDEVFFLKKEIDHRMKTKSLEPTLIKKSDGRWKAEKLK